MRNLFAEKSLDSDHEIVKQILKTLKCKVLLGKYTHYMWAREIDLEWEVCENKKSDYIWQAVSLKRYCKHDNKEAYLKRHWVQNIMHYLHSTI